MVLVCLSGSTCNGGMGYDGSQIALVTRLEVERDMRQLTRRQFLRLAAASGAGVVATGSLAGCATPTEQVTPSGRVTPSATPQAEILRNENVPGFYVRYEKPFPAPDPAEWRLTVEGLVRNPQSLIYTRCAEFALLVADQAPEMC